MHDYMAVRLEISPCNENITDLLAAFLAEGDYDTFEPDSSGLTAYVRKDKFDSNFVENVISEFPITCHISFSAEEIKGQDWNREWEQNYFHPILIDDKVVIRSSFHTDFPQAPIEIVVDPKMAFGTGHHATTAGMAHMLLEEDLKGKSVIDMGTGTGILTILAKKLGAGDSIGIDIDEFAIENARENAALNNIDSRWIVGDDKALEALDSADIFLANINLNVITANLEKYIGRLLPGGKIFLSGFLNSDRESIIDKAISLGLQPVKEMSSNNWMTMVFRKP